MAGFIILFTVVYFATQAALAFCVDIIALDKLVYPPPKKW
jgi:hypothetical protein